VSLRIASWNIEGRLSVLESKHRASSDKIIDSIKEIDADALLLIEAHSETSLDKLDTVRKKLQQIGYYLYDIPYSDDMKERTDTTYEQLSLMFLSKLPVDKFEIVKLGNFRNVFIVTLREPKSNQLIRIIGLHLDDRLEKTRLNQVRDLIKIVNKSKMPTIVMGDFNAMHGEDLWPAKFLRSKIVRWLARLILPSIFIRATEMAKGEALKLLESQTNLSDIDPAHQPTTTPKMRGLEWLPSIRLIQIDHIFASKNIKTRDFKITPDLGSDHRAIITTLDIN
jgi:endonuclease/exonuclease/phosphatase family metal-dependent hydrolase